MIILKKIKLPRNSCTAGEYGHCKNSPKYEIRISSFENGGVWSVTTLCETHLKELGLLIKCETDKGE